MNSVPPASMTSSSVSRNPWKLGGLRTRTLAARVWRESQEDELLGRAAQLSFYFLLALFPALLFLTALLGLMPTDRLLPELMVYLRTVLPADALSLVERYLEQVVEGAGTSILSLGLLGALWASSSGMTAIMDALNAVYDAPESRPFWKLRLVAMAMTIGLAGLIIASTALVLYGERIGEWVADMMGVGWLFGMAWKILQWPLVIVLMLIALAVVYYVSPNVSQAWQWVTPGSAAAVVLWLVVALGFKLYVENFGDYNKVYGSIGGVIVLMLWFYLSSIVLLVGGEINAEIERAASEQAGKRADPPVFRASPNQ